MKTIRVATPYDSVDELVAGYARFCEPGACFVPAAQRRPVGLVADFAIQLADGTGVLRGCCEVVATYTAKTSPYGRAGVRLAIRSLTPDSSRVYARLLEPPRLARGSRPSFEPVPEPIPDDATVRTELEPAYSTKPTVAIEAIHKQTVLGIAPMRAAAAPAAPLMIRAEPTRLPRPRRGWLARVIAALARLVRCRPQPRRSAASHRTSASSRATSTGFAR